MKQGCVCDFNISPKFLQLCLPESVSLCCSPQWYVFSGDNSPETINPGPSFYEALITSLNRMNAEQSRFRSERRTPDRSSAQMLFHEISFPVQTKHFLCFFYWGAMVAFWSRSCYSTGQLPQMLNRRFCAVMRYQGMLLEVSPAFWHLRYVGASLCRALGGCLCAHASLSLLGVSVAVWWIGLYLHEDTLKKKSHRKLEWKDTFFLVQKISKSMQSFLMISMYQELLEDSSGVWLMPPCAVYMRR